MKQRTVIGAILLCIGTVSTAGNLTCAENDLTHAYMCFHNGKVRVNGAVRATPLYQGGPKSVDDTGFTARVHCETRVMELTDRKGVAFARNVPSERVGLDFIRYLCTHKQAKNDPSLSTR